jgi:glycogen synthase
MRILILSNFYPPEFLGGYELGCSQVVSELKQRGHEVLVLCSATLEVPCEAFEPGVQRVLSLANLYSGICISESHKQLVHHQAKVSQFFNVFQLLRFLRLFQPEVTYIFNPLGLGGLAIFDVLNFLGIPWVWHLMDSIPGQLISEISEEVKILFSCGYSGDFSNGFHISMSQVLLSEIAGYELNLGKNVKIIPGWTTPLKNLPTDREYCLAGLTRFVFVGSISKHKGVDCLLEAIKILRHQGIEQFHVDFYGDGDIQKYVAIAARMGIENLITFCGSRQHEQLLECYHSYDVVLFPSWEREPFGFVPIEASAEGCLAIMTRQVGAAERLVNNVHCIKVNRAPEGFADAMHRVITNHTLLESIARRGTRLTRYGLNLSTLAGEIEDVLYKASHPVKWESIDWQEAHRLAFVKDQTSLLLLSRQL